MSRSPWSATIPLAAALALAGCGTNPVTGERELSLVSTDQEISLGRENYGPYRQTAGGDYVLEPALNAYVSEVGQRLARVSDRKLPYEFRVVNDSSPNAWALPGGKLAINRGLLVELDSEAELAAVLGHEIVHAAARHGAQGMERSTVLQGALIAAGVALGGSDYRDLAMMGAEVGANLVNQKYDRDAEREADLYGMRYMARAGYDPQAAVALQETFVRLAEGKDSNWLSGLFASHPPSRERVENNRRTAVELKVADGEIGRGRYQQKIARLRRNRPAYEAYDEAREAVRAGDKRRALSLVDKAIAIEPKESLFHGLRGDLLSERDDQQDALAAYDRAVALNPDYFKHYLTRGFVRRSAGDPRGAEADFRRSLDLLPTAEARYGLGRLAMDAGRRDEAIAEFRQAANADTAVGKAAARDLARLDLEENPARYLRTALGLDGSGYLNIVVQNMTSVAVREVRLVVGERTPVGLRERASYRLSGVLGPGEQRRVRTDLGPVSSATAQRLAAVVTDARVAR